MTKDAAKVRQSFARILNDLDFHQSIISRTRGRFKKYPARSFLYVVRNGLWKCMMGMGHGPLISARTFWGDTMRVFFPAYKSVYHFGILDSWELVVQKTLVEQLKEGDVFFDVGANVGFYTLLAGALVGEKGQVHAFEPTPSTFALLTQNTEGNPSITLNPMALGESAGEATLTDFGPLDSGLNSIHFRGHEGLKATHLQVPITTLDLYCEKNGSIPTLIKIDVEGMELQVLRGAHEVLQKARPTLIIEVGAYEVYAELFVFLEAAGYSAYRATQTLELVAYVPDLTHGRMNMVFVPNKLR